MALTLEQLLIQIKLQGASPTQQQLKAIKQEVRDLEGALNSLGTLGGITYILSQLDSLLGVFAEVSGLKIAAEFRSVAYSLEAVTGSAQKAARFMREIKELSANSPFDVQTLAGQAAQMIGLGVPENKVMPELKTLVDALSKGGVRSADAGSVLFNLLQIRGMGSAKANFMDIRQMITRAPGMTTMLAQGLGVGTDKLMETLRGKSMSGEQVYSAVLKGAEAMAQGAAAARMLADPLTAVTKLFEMLNRIMEPTGQILLAMGMPLLLVARGIATFLIRLNELTGGVAGMAFLIGGTLWIATRTATQALWRFVQAMLATAGAARAGSGSVFAGGGSSGLWRGIGIGATLGFAGELGAMGLESMGKPGENAYGAGKLRAFGTGAGIGAILGSILPGLGTAAGAALGGALGLIFSFVSDHFAKPDSTSPMVSEQKKTNQILENLHATLRGGGPRTAAEMSRFVAEYQLERWLAFG